MAVKKLMEAPVSMDAEKIAEGILDMFTDDERVALRFGMLPAQKMESLERTLQEKLRTYVAYEDGDECVAMPADDHSKRFARFKMSELVREAMHEVTLALYAIGDLVV